MFFSAGSYVSVLPKCLVIADKVINSKFYTKTLSHTCKIYFRNGFSSSVFNIHSFPWWWTDRLRLRIIAVYHPIQAFTLKWQKTPFDVYVFENRDICMRRMILRHLSYSMKSGKNEEWKYYLWTARQVNIRIYPKIPFWANSMECNLLKHFLTFFSMAFNLRSLIYLSMYPIKKNMNQFNAIFEAY